jgi:hypothetical protein
MAVTIAVQRKWLQIDQQCILHDMVVMTELAALRVLVHVFTQQVSCKTADKKTLIGVDFQPVLE